MICTCWPNVYAELIREKDLNLSGGNYMYGQNNDFRL